MIAGETAISPRRTSNTVGWHMRHEEERRESVLTEADIAAIVTAVSNCQKGCSFTVEETQQVKDILQMYKETRSAAWKAVLGIFGVFILWMLVLASTHGLTKLGGK
jgi:hypothetical protein